METNSELIQLIDWNSVQAHIQVSTQTQFPARKQIWWACLGQNIGVEVNGKNAQFARPVLVLKEFNAGSLFVAPLTNTVGAHKYLIEFDYLGKKQSINISQLRTLSAKRFTKKMSDISEDDFKRIIISIKELVLS